MRVRTEKRATRLVVSISRMMRVRLCATHHSILTTLTCGTVNSLALVSLLQSFPSDRTGRHASALEHSSAVARWFDGETWERLGVLKEPPHTAGKREKTLHARKSFTLSTLFFVAASFPECQLSLCCDLAGGNVSTRRLRSDVLSSRLSRREKDRKARKPQRHESHVKRTQRAQTRRRAKGKKDAGGVRTLNRQRCTPLS